MLVCKLHYFSGNLWKNSQLSFKTNRIVRYSDLNGFIFLANLSCGDVAILIVAAGLFLIRLSYNDVVDDLDVQGLQKKLIFNNFNV